MNYIDKLVAVPLEANQELVGYVKEIEDSEEEGIVIVTMFLPEEEQVVGVVCYLEDIELRTIH